MSTAECFATSILIEKQGVHILTWDNKGDLIRALIVILAVTSEIPIESLLLSSAEDSTKGLGPFLEIQPISGTLSVDRELRLRPPREAILLLFLQQAASTTIGPFLNGWRSALVEPPGTVLVIRTADLIAFQRNAPDLASFIGPRMVEASTMLSIWSQKAVEKLRPSLPAAVSAIVQNLPGDQPTEKEIEDWIIQHPPIDNDGDSTSGHS